ncbi:UDP-Glycosyltransferase/glycogen phosphorylase [Mycena rosella]|uniref:UDP-Glycosyltransferase/glycogen phosphorylase n=1 Tax=Mycena rosella TaxID=1033263 RepID=A0AAD7GAP7_MYCRO|nr:UDP-Glycosyltransferase/glycogen phosphorylase [Mycena rosella]
MSGALKIRHLLLVPIPAYGHTRPLCSLAGRLAVDPSVVITLLMAPNYLEQVRSDIAAQFPSGHEAFGRIRIVSLFDSTEKNAFGLMPATVEHYPAAYKSLVDGNAIECASTGTKFAAIPPPAVVILDVFANPQLNATRAMTGTTIPIFTFIAGNCGSLLRAFGPESLGGRGNFGAKIEAEALRTGKSAEEIGEQLFRHTDGTVIKIPGVPAMYDYEVFPQISLGGHIVPIVTAGYEVVMNCDGILLGTAPAYDGESLVAVETWVNRRYTSPYTQSDLSSLQDMISFGSVFWPKSDGQLEELVDALIEKDFPFILCHASPMASVSDKLLSKIKDSGIGMASAWAPQQFVLTHPATGWFLTHGGHGGITESLAAGVPMICWPFEADQPIAAEHLSQNLNVAFHLIEVRTAKGLQPLHSGRVPLGTSTALRAEFREIIDQCRGEPGAGKRKQAQRMRDAFAEAWTEGGSAQVAVRAFFSEYVSGA